MSLFSEGVPIRMPFILAKYWLFLFNNLCSIIRYNSLILQAIGEPPLFLASSVFFAIKDVISLARTEFGLTDHFTINSPATAERIRMVCEDDLIKKVFVIFF
jgi:hypothetical protein